MSTTSYDDVLYPSYVHPQTHPNHLGALATLFGMHPKSLDDARVLELACGQGGNLIPIAKNYPKLTCLGIDLSQRQIELGQVVIDQAALTNIELRAQSILDFSIDEGEFDYIIAHGVYSWVPEAVRDKILSICRHHLSNQGIAIVSYNTFPGWHQRRMIRDMMLFHTKRFTEPAKRIEQAKAFLTFMTQAVDSESAYGRSLHEEFRTLSQSDESYLFHEQLEAVNEPLYFHEFAEQLKAHELQYVCETEPTNLQLERHPPKIAEVLSKMEIVEREQYLDFMLRRTFRQTLISHAEVSVNRSSFSENIRRLRLALPHEHLANKTRLPDQPVVLRSREGIELSVRDPFTIAACEKLAECSPKALTFDELASSVSSDADEESKRTLAGTLAHAYIYRIVQVSV
jgi:SAM-dependent methyltransferase